tara:strand:+ start:7936 stop:9171 length:1236 start_codon:yes stop_codon:yes gene_type:complete
MTNCSEKVLITGSGFAGLITAITLKKSKISCKVFEADPAPVNSGDRITLFTNSMKLLRLVDVADEVIKNGFIVEIVKFQDHFGKHMVVRSMGKRSTYGEPTITIKRSKLHKILLNKAEELGLEISYGKKVVEVEDHKNYAKIIFEDGTNYSGSIVVGCDGINSIIRRSILNKNILPNYSGQIYFGGFVYDQELVKKLDLKSETVYATVGPTNFFSYCYLKNPEKKKDDAIHWNCFLNQPKRLSKDDLDKLSDKDVIVRVAETYKNWHEPVEKIIANTTEIWKTSLSDIVEIDSWFKGRLLVIGDAAHAMNPLLGQGAGTAMEDGYAFAKLLKKYINDHNLAFSTLEKLRKNRTTFIARKARKNSKRTTFKFNKLIIKLRNKVFSIVTFLTPERKLNKIQLYDIEKELEKII